MGLMVGLEAFLMQALIPFFIFLLIFPILFLCAPGGWDIIFIGSFTGVWRDGQRREGILFHTMTLP